MVSEQHGIYSFFAGASGDQDARSGAQDQDGIQAAGGDLSLHLKGAGYILQQYRRCGERLGERFQSAVGWASNLAAEENRLAQSPRASGALEGILKR